MGRLHEAILDQQEYIKSSAEYGNDTEPSPQLRHDREHARQMETQLEAAFANNPGTKTDVACSGYWDWGEDKRAPSPLLAPADAAVAVAKPSTASPAVH